MTKNKLGRRLKNCWQLYIFLLPALVWLIVFCYGPMYGLIIAFKNFKVNMPMWSSPSVGFKYFKMFFQSNIFETVLKNTLTISLACMIFGFPAPIFFALALKQVRNKRFQGLIRMVTYLPNFISIVALVSMLSVFFSSTGFVNTIAAWFGAEEFITYTDSKYFLPIYVISGIWQGLGYNAIIYLAALSSVNPELYEAADLDGASTWHKIWHIDIPCILPTIVIMLILSVGNLMSVGYEKVLLMQDSMNIMDSEIISTYVYKLGIQGTQYSYSTAIGLFNAVINFVLIITANLISKKAADVSLF